MLDDLAPDELVRLVDAIAALPGRWPDASTAPALWEITHSARLGAPFARRLLLLLLEDHDEGGNARPHLVTAYLAAKSQLGEPNAVFPYPSTDTPRGDLASEQRRMDEFSFGMTLHRPREAALA